MEKKAIYSLQQPETITKISKALSNPQRIEILNLLSFESLSVSELSKKMGQPLSSISSSIAILENAGLVATIIQAGKHGSMKLCSLLYEQVAFDMMKPIDEENHTVKTFDIPLGSYFSADIFPTCGMTSETAFLGRDDDIKTFYKANRFEAQLLWFYKGFIEYRIPFDVSKNLDSIELTMEICSEAPNYRMEWPSDITILINNQEIGTWTCPGDFGGRRGQLTPQWWPINSTQYGLLKTWQVTREGTFLDYKRISTVALNNVLIHKNDYVSIKIGIKPDAQNIGGINLFGKKFGDFGNGLVARLVYKQ